MKRISLEKLINSYENASNEAFSYKEQCQYVKGLIETGKIKPVWASGTNGKSPALYCEYWIVEKEKDYSELKEELLYRLVPEISIDYYMTHLKSYEQDRKWVLCLNEFLRKQKEQLGYPKSVNERSFEIWQREKFLTKEQGKKILKRCQIDIEKLNVYETTEPLAYYSHTRQTPQNILIIENKDTFFSMRKHLLSCTESEIINENKNEKSKILGMSVGTLIYGAGKGIFGSFQDFEFCVEPYMKNEGNQIYYLGDLDYEGIGIYENFAQMFCGKWEIKPFVEGYETMIKKAETMGQLPDTKTGQNKNIRELFFSYFSSDIEEKMKVILQAGRYIPQEILNITDFSEE